MSRHNRRNKQNKQHRNSSKNFRVNSPNNVRINSPNTAYFIHYNAPHLCNCKKHKHSKTKVKAADINIDNIIKTINKSRKTTNKADLRKSRSTSSTSSAKLDKKYRSTSSTSSAKLDKKSKSYSNEDFTSFNDVYETLNNAVRCPANQSTWNPVTIASGGFDYTQLSKNFSNEYFNESNNEHFNESNNEHFNESSNEYFNESNNYESNNYESNNEHFNEIQGHTTQIHDDNGLDSYYKTL